MADLPVLRPLQVVTSVLSAEAGLSASLVVRQHTSILSAVANAVAYIVLLQV